ncbi:MAG: 16S rRNA (adenine(1518)-N(6)/adenine(1519)-N(6))-dimethyltransferase RsmA [Alphaproteobacteria bacterium]|nr:16S rRNA (adenine(1518)-N(6)/adenine(1519)-N(6))-dimethyltransferase RsmA [Alphaproteobacteria bacterium]
MAEAAPELPPLREVIRRHGLGALKSLGQNFLLDLNLTARIARAAGDLSACTVYEVGPGPGGLTRALLAAGARRVVAVERDRRCIAALAELAAAWPGRLEVIEGDALSIDEDAVLDPGPCRVVANLPYNVGTALLLKWLQRPKRFDGYTLMFQKEVALRLVAAPGSKEYGRLSVLVQWLCEARRLFDIPPRAFTPPPKVTSSLVALTPLPAPRHPAERARLEAVLAAAFGQRRKMLRAALRAYSPASEAALARAGIAPTARAEELGIDAFCRLARAFDEI